MKEGKGSVFRAGMPAGRDGAGRMAFLLRCMRLGVSCRALCAPEVAYRACLSAHRAQMPFTM